jgi:sugar phosphate isomerase/epimerase
MRLSIASYSFHRRLEAGQQDMFQYIRDCQALGATVLEPWNGHLAPLVAGDEALKASGRWQEALLSADEKAYLEQVSAAARRASLPFGCIAVDGAHIYEPTPEARQLNRAVAYRWLQAAHQLGAAQVRIDAGQAEGFPEAAFRMVVEGYRDLIARGRELGLEILFENHWGISHDYENVLKLLAAVDGLGLLFDTHNWRAGTQPIAWRECARFARSVHIKTFRFDEAGNDPSVDLALAIRLLVDAGYAGTWGVESVPEDGDELGAAEKTLALIRRELHALGAA